MKKVRVLETIVIVAGMSIACWAQGGMNLADENAQLKSRVDNLEKQVQDLTTAVGAQDQQTPKNADKKSLWSSLDVQFYGFLKADAAYDNSRTTSGNYAVWVNRETSNSNDNEFNLTANETRLGFMLTGPKSATLETKGCVEFDFFGSYAEENKAKIQMRHAYLQVLWPESHFSILAGQTWDVISPLNPSTLNYTVLWDAGNVGYRRPQMRLTKEFTLSAPKTTLNLQGAISRTIGRDVLGPGAPSESGEDAGFPTLQGRVGLTFPWLEVGPTTIGVSAHWGQEEYDLTATGASRDFDSWSVNLDLQQPICKKATLKAELFAGENLGTYFGGIGQTVRAVKDANGVTTGYANEIGAKGGWCAVALGPWKKATFNVGIGLDDVQRDDVNTGDRTLNRSIFGNVLYALNSHTDVGFELSHWKTDYKGPGDADDVRLQASFKYKF
jgi:hypothetical protein